VAANRALVWLSVLARLAFFLFHLSFSGNIVIKPFGLLFFLSLFKVICNNFGQMWLVAHAHFPVNQDQKSTNTTSLPSTSGNPANNSNCRGALCFSCFRSCYTSPQLYWFLLYLQKVNTNENRKKET